MNHRLLAAVLSTLLSPFCIATEAPFDNSAFVLPDSPVVDEFGVNMVGLNSTFSFPEFRLGSLSHSMTLMASDRDIFYGFNYAKDSKASSLAVADCVSLPLSYLGEVHHFLEGCSNFPSMHNYSGTGAMATEISTGNYLLTLADGTEVLYERYYYDTSSGNYALKIVNVTKPSGEMLTYHYELVSANQHSVIGVTSSMGYAVVYDLSFSASFSDIEVRGLNLAYDYCNLNSIKGCDSSDALSVLYDYNSSQSVLERDVTIHHVNGTSSLVDFEYLTWPGYPSTSGTRITQVTRAGELPVSYKYDTVSYCWNDRDWSWVCSNQQVGIVYEATVGERTATYNLDTPHQYHGYTVRNEPDGEQLLVNLDTTKRPAVAQSAVNGPSIVTYITTQGATRIDCAKTSVGERCFTYDDRGNVLSVSTLSGVTTRVFPTNCSNPKTCNKPTQVIDLNGNVTDLEYHAASGQPSLVTYPADEQGNRSLRRYVYQQLTPMLRSSSGGWTSSNTPIWVLSHEEFCPNASAGSNECLKTEYQYDVYQNLSVIGTKQVADGQSLLTCYEYDYAGNQISVTTPNAQLASCP